MSPGNSERIKSNQTTMSHILDNPADISAYRLLLLRSGLKLEIAGLRHSTNSVFKAAKQLTGEKTRIKCLEAINRMIEQA